MGNDWGSRHTAALALMLAACSGGKTVDLGGDDQLLVSGGGVCDSSGIGRGSFYVGTYDALTKLEGCREIHGDLYIGRLDVPDLTPLSQLRAVDGWLELGALPYDDGTLSGVMAVPSADPPSTDRDLPRPGDVWFPSLAGLGALESARDLRLAAIGPADLSELASLRSIGAVLAIDGAPALDDLSQLQGVSVQSLYLSDVLELVSLRGFEPPRDLGELVVNGAPKLVDIEPLAGVETVRGVIQLSGTAVENLDALSTVGWVFGGITLQENEALVDINGLDGLYTLPFLTLGNNRRLERVPNFRRLDEIEWISVWGNDALVEFAPTMPSLEPFQDFPAEPYGPSFAMIRIDNNAALRRVALPRAADAMRGVFVDANPSLQELDLGGIERLDALAIRGNATLTSVTLSELQTVADLSVLENPLLSLGAFANVRTFTTTMSGNADELAP